MAYTICLGEVWVDCFAEQPSSSLNDIACWIPLPGGALANVACALAKLGNDVQFVGAVGEDRWGSALLRLLQDVKVGCRWVQQRHKAPTREVYFVENAAASSREAWDRPDSYSALSTSLGVSNVDGMSFAGFSRRDPTVFADAHLFASGLASNLFADANFLTIGTLSLAYPDTREALEQVVAIALSHRVPILVDVSWRPMFWPNSADAPGRIYDLLRRVHLLKVSKSEANWLFGTESAIAIARQLPHMKGVLVTTRGGGTHYCFGEVIGQVPSFKVDVEDTAGASDAFTAGLVHQLVKRGLPCLYDDKTAYEVVRYASAMSALTTTRLGAIAALPTLNEVEVFLYLN